MLQRRRSERLLLRKVALLSKQKCDVTLVKYMLELLLVNLYNLGVNVLQVNDQVRDNKASFDKFIYSICRNIAVQCKTVCDIDDHLYN